MQMVIQGVTIIDPASPFNQSRKDIRIQNGMITEISDAISTNHGETAYNFEGLCISPGWFDMLASFGDPGHEQKEDLLSGTNAASAGGFTSVAIMPDTDPALHSKSEIEYIRHKASSLHVNIYPYGAITKNRAGKELTEMYDMRNAGAIAFTDADHAVEDAGIMLRSLLYVKSFNGVVINIPNDHRIVGNAVINEGMMSTQLGMYGIPDILEELMVIRDIRLAEYSDSKLHLGVISSAKSLPHIRDAKKRGVQVTASVSAIHLFFDENELHEYDSDFKINPPLRTKDDISKLKNAVKDGTIDAICSYHIPHERDAKQVEFEYASNGMESLEATFGAANTALHNVISLEQLIEKISINPRKILGINVPSVSNNTPSELTVFDPNMKYTFNRSHIYSKSSNSGFIGRELTGKAVATINRNQIKTYSYGRTT